MENLIIKQTRVLYNRPRRGGTKTYMRLFTATDKRYPTSFAGIGTTKQQAIKDLGRILLNTASLDDETGRLEQGWEYLKY